MSITSVHKLVGIFVSVCNSDLKCPVKSIEGIPIPLILQPYHMYLVYTASKSYGMGENDCSRFQISNKFDAKQIIIIYLILSLIRFLFHFLTLINCNERLATSLNLISMALRLWDKQYLSEGCLLQITNTIICNN